MDDIEGFRTSVEEVNADTVETARGTEAACEAVSELLWPHAKTLMGKELNQVFS